MQVAGIILPSLATIMQKNAQKLCIYKYCTYFCIAKLKQDEFTTYIRLLLLLLLPHLTSGASRYVVDKA